MRNKWLVFLAVVLLVPWGLGFAQTAPPEPSPSQARLTPDQLDTLVAPVALYPDPLLGQVLAASTYPLEIVEAEQWLQANPNLHGAQLTEAARQQNWDASVQALVAFPDVLAMLARDVSWTTSLGNAFLAQQQDVMNEVQHMRLEAQQNGKLRSTPQQTVTTQSQDGQSAIVIEPADPQVIYVPVYNPEYVWGPPVWGYYPPLWYPGLSFGFGFGPAVYLGGFFPGWGIGWPGWGLGWGWGCGWFGGGLFVNAVFFNHFGFHNFEHGGAFAGGRFGGNRFAWQHDPFHRGGVPYANRGVASRFNNARFTAGRFNAGSRGASLSGSRFAGPGVSRGFNSPGARGFTGTSNASRGFAPANRGGAMNSNRGWQQFNRGAAPQSRSFTAPNTATNSRGFAGTSRGFSTPQGRGFSSPRTFSAPQTRNFSAPRGFAAPQTRNFSAPRTFSAPQTRGFAAPRGFSAPPARSFSTPRNFGGSSRGFSAPRSGGGFGGGHSFGGGGRSFGGGGRSFGGGGHSGGGGGRRR